MTMNESNRLKAFMKIGFHEEDIEKKKISLSCGQCRVAVKASECKIVESTITNSRRYKERLQLLCGTCNTLIIGADV